MHSECKDTSDGHKHWNAEEIVGLELRNAVGESLKLAGTWECGHYEGYAEKKKTESQENVSEHLAFLSLHHCQNESGCNKWIGNVFYINEKAQQSNYPSGEGCTDVRSHYDENGLAQCKYAGIDETYDHYGCRA